MSLIFRIQFGLNEQTLLNETKTKNVSPPKDCAAVLYMVLCQHQGKPASINKMSELFCRSITQKRDRGVLRYEAGLTFRWATDPISFCLPAIISSTL